MRGELEQDARVLGEQRPNRFGGLTGWDDSEAATVKTQRAFPK